MTKRKRPSNNDAAETDSLSYDEPKRPRAVKPSSSNARVDPTSGQRSAIPGLDDLGPEDDDLDGDEFEVDDDALTYLRAVRAEASTIPTVLIAPKGEHAEYDNGVGDSRGFYADGAYTAAPADQDEDDNDYAEDAAGVDAQTAYYSALLSRFDSLREDLRREPPEEVVLRLDRDHPRVMRGDTKDWRAWRWRIGNTEPVKAQLAGMDRGSVLRLLRLVSGPGGYMPGGSKGITGRTSRWLWSLLGKLPERGELGSEEVGIVREVGKKAVWVGVGMRGVDTSGLDGGDGNEDEEEVVDMVVEDGDGLDGAEDEADDDDNGSIIGPIQGPLQAVPGSDSPLQQPDHTAEPSLDDGGDNAEALAAARRRLLDRIEKQDNTEVEDGEVRLEAEIKPDVPIEDTDEGIRNNTRTTVDMVLTIVGEMYGQRDLLEFREVWV